MQGVGAAGFHVFYQEAVRDPVNDRTPLDDGGILRLVDLLLILYFRLFPQIIAVQIVGQNAGYHYHERDDQFEESGEHDAHLAFRQGLGSERTLHDVLVEAPVKKVGNPQAQAKGRPRDFGIVRRTDHMQLAAHSVHAAGRIPGIKFKETRYPVPEAVGRIPQGSHRSPGIGGCGLHQVIRICSAQGHQGKIGHYAAAYNQGGAPEQVRPGTGLQTAHEYIHGTAECDDDAADGNIAKVDTHGAVAGKEYGNHLGPGVNNAGGRHAHQNQERSNSHQGTCRSIIALFQEFRNGIHPAFQQFGKETESHDHQRNGGQPFITGNRHAHPVGGLAGHAHKLLRGNIGGNQGKADEPPGQAAAGQEIVGSALCFLFFFRLLRITALPDTQSNDTYDHHTE